MINVETFRDLAMSFAEVEEAPHFDRASFKTKKKIFATLQKESLIANLKLSLIDQSVFCAFDKEVIYPINNKWRQQGWTSIDLQKIKKGMLKDALQAAYEQVGAKKK